MILWLHMCPQWLAKCVIPRCYIKMHETERDGCRLVAVSCPMYCPRNQSL